jgi:predicted dehydrogenase
VCTRNDRHVDVVSAALAARTHVICEKPLATTVDAARDLAAAARRSGVFTALAHNYRFFPLVAELAARVRAGAFGGLHLVRGHYLQDWLLGAESTDWRVDEAVGGASRAIADIGTHWIDLAELVAGRRVTAVIATTTTLHASREGRDVRTEDQAALLLRFGDGLAGAFVVSQIAAGHTNDIELVVEGAGASAAWRMDRPDELWIGRPDGATIVARDGVASPEASELATWGEGPNLSRRNFLRAAYDVIRGDRDAASLPLPLPTFDDGVHLLEVVAAALASARTGRWVDVADEAGRGG